MAQNNPSLSISNFSSLICCVITLFFIQGFQNATFGVKNTALAQKLDKIAIFTYIHREPPSSNLLFGKTQKFCRNRLDQAGISSIPNSLIQTESKYSWFQIAIFENRDLTRLSANRKQVETNRNSQIAKLYAKLRRTSHTDPGWIAVRF